MNGQYVAANGYQLPTPVIQQGNAEAAASIGVGSRIDAARVRHVRTRRRVIPMKQDSTLHGCCIDSLLKVNQVYRNKFIHMLFNNLLQAASIGCFYMTIESAKLTGLCLLLWVD